MKDSNATEILNFFIRPQNQSILQAAEEFARGYLLEIENDPETNWLEKFQASRRLATALKAAGRDQ